MADQRAPAAVGTFKEWLQKAVSCVSDAIINLSPNGYRPSPLPHRLTLGDGTPVPVKADTPSGEVRLALTVIQWYRIQRAAERGPWKVNTAAYYYALDAADSREIFAYHWHPAEEGIKGIDAGTVSYPHLHIGRGAVRRDIAPNVDITAAQNALQPNVAAAHFPTRRIALEDMLRLLIEQFHVQPARSDWDRRLREARASFTRDRTWV